MAAPQDPYRTLGLARGATMAEVKQAYRRLAKANHPDAAGEAALPRFLAIQSAYDQIAGPDGGAGAGPGARAEAGPARRPWDADPDRAGATRRAYGGRTRRDASGGTGSRSGAGRSGRTGGSAGRPGDGATGRGTTGGDSGGGGTADGDDRRDRPPNKATLGSTSYDGVDREPFEPDWGGASWYGTTSGTYWTLNPKEYADPRKHGPEYQARARRRKAPPTADPDIPIGRPDGAAVDGAGSADRAGAAGAAAGDADGAGGARTAPPTHAAASWWDARAGERPPADAGTARPTGPSAAGRSRRPATTRAASSGAPIPTADDLGRSLRAWLGDPRPGIVGRLTRAVAGWVPVALGIGWVAGELSGCARFVASCDPTVAPLTWIVQLATLLGLIVVGPLARIAAVATVATLLAVVPGAILLLATSDPSAVAAGRTALGWLMAAAWAGGVAYGAVRESRPAGDGPPTGGTATGR